MKLTPLEKIRTLLAKESAAAFILLNQEGSGQPGTRHLSGFTGSASVIVISKEKSFFQTDGRYFGQYKNEVKKFTFSRQDKASVSALLNKILAKSRSRKVLFDGTKTSFADWQKIMEKVPQAQFISSDNILQEIRRIKQSDEIASVKKACATACKSFVALLPYLQRGVTEEWVARKLEALMEEYGSERPAFETIVASGKNASLPHAKPTKKKFAYGELVVIDFGATVNGYVSDITRTIAIGRPSARLKRIYESVRRAHARGCRMIKSGVRVKAVDAACRLTLQKENLSRYFIHSTGHGLGLEIHELPRISSGAIGKLEAGSIITCEPGVYIDNLSGVRIEDTLLVTKTGAKNFTGDVTTDLITI